MGGKCCSDRHKAKDGGPGGAPKEQRKSTFNNYSDKKGGRAISIGYQSKGDDAEKFDKAFESNDLKAFVSLLKSTQPIESFEERMHPWAEDPKTVGALAGTQLAILASMAEQSDPTVKVKIREAGAIAPLVEFLRSEQEDRVQTAVVALSFLTADCEENTVQAYEAGALELLMKHVDSPVAGMRAATATTLRNICMAKDDYRTKFVALGGLKGLVDQLDMNPDPALNNADVQLEAVLNLQDLLEDEEGNTIDDYVKKAKEAGAEPKLRKMLENEDEEVRSSAQELLESLASVK